MEVKVKFLLNFKSTFFRKFVLSSVIIFAIPLLCTSLLFTFHFSKILKTEAFNNQQVILEQSKNSIESQIDRMKNIASEINFNKDFQKFQFNGNLREFGKISSNLHGFTVSNSFFEKTFVYFFNEEYLYSDTSSYPLDFFINNIYKYQGFKDGEFREFINQMKKPTVLPAMDLLPNTKYVSFFYPFFVDGNHTGVILFLVNEDKFKVYLNNPNEKQFYIVTDENNSIITSMGSGLSDSDVKEITKREKDDGAFQIVDIKGEKYFFTHSQKEKNNKFNYLYLTPVKDVLKDTKSIQLLYSIVMVIICFIGILLIGILTKYNYNPIKNLVEKSKAYIEQSSGNSYQDEVLLANRTMDFLFGKNKVLEDKLTHYSKYFLLSVLKHKFVSEEEILKEATEVGVKFERQSFQVILISAIKRNQSLVETYDYGKEINELFDDVDFYYVDSLDEQMIFIINFDTEQWLNNEKCESIKSLYFENYALEIVISAGCIYDKVNLLHKSFVEAMVAYKYGEANRLKEVYTLYSSIPKEWLDKINEKGPEQLIDLQKEKQIAKKMSIKHIKKNEMTNYINQHYLEYNFSVQEMADHFGVNLSYLSQYFKESIGETILDYVTRMKTEKSRDLLESTDYSIEKIGEMVGYSNVSSFIRRFKQVSGMTPGEFRKNNTK